MLSRLAAVPLFAAAAHAGQRLRPASQPASRFERRVRRISEIRPRRRSPAARLAGLRPIGSVLRQGIRGRHQPPLLSGRSTPAVRWVSVRGGTTKVEYAQRIAGALGYLPCSRETRSAWRAWPTAWSGTCRPGEIRPTCDSIFDLLEQTRPQGETQLAPVLHELAETIRQRALIVIFSDLFIDPELLRGCFQHLRFRRHDVAIFHLLDPQEIDFNFRRPMRFLDMEGGPSIFADPTRSPTVTTGPWTDISPR